MSTEPQSRAGGPRGKPTPKSRRLGGLAQSDIRAMTRASEELGAVNLGQGICDLPTPPLVRDAAIQAIQENRSIYSYPEGLATLREEISAKLLRDNGIEADPERNVVVTTGSAGAFTCALHALLDPGDGLMLLEPFYGYHRNAALLAGLEVHTHRLEAPGFRLDGAALEASLRPSTRAIVICTPSNPCGRMFTREELEELARVARERDLLVLTDEIYEYIRYEGREHISPATVADLGPRTVTIMGLSKTFSITGWRLGYAVAQDEEVARALTLVHDLFYICAPTPLQHGVAAGFRSPPGFFEDMRADYAAKRERILGALVAAGLDPIAPEGAYYVLADASSLERGTAKEAAMELLEGARVASVPGSAFYDQAGGEGERLLRFCFAKQDADLDEACRRLEAFGQKRGVR